MDDVGALAELLLESGRSVPTVKNYCTAIKSLYVQWNNQNVVRAFESPTWRMMLRGITLSIGLSADRRTVVELEDLKAMIGICNTDVSLQPLKVALLFRFFGYLRISNLAPPTMDQFDATRHTSWADSFTKGVPLQIIKQHGTWKSSAVEDYLIKTPLFTTPVAQTFINTLTNH